MTAQLVLAGAVGTRGVGLSPHAKRSWGAQWSSVLARRDGVWGWSRRSAWGDSFAGGYARASGGSCVG